MTTLTTAVDGGPEPTDRVSAPARAVLRRYCHSSRAATRVAATPHASPGQAAATHRHRHQPTPVTPQRTFVHHSQWPWPWPWPWISIHCELWSWITHTHAKTRKLSSIEDRGQTDRVLTLTGDFQFQSPASHGSCTIPRFTVGHRQRFPKIEF